MILNALIEVWPNETGIYIDRLPGLYASGPDEHAALDVLPDTVEQHLAWLATHGAMALPGEPLQIEIAERIAAIEGKHGPLFDADRQTPAQGDIDHALGIAALGRRDLIDLYRSVSGMRRISPPADGDWSIADHLLHVAALDLFYIEPFSQSPRAALSEGPVHALLHSGAEVERVLSSLTPELQHAVIDHQGEQWTLGKVLRRMTAHIREHEPWVRRIARGSPGT